MNKRGQVGNTAKKAGAGLLSKLFSSKPKEQSSGGDQQKSSLGLKTVFILIVVLLLLPIIGFYAYNYASSSQGQVNVQNAMDFVKENNPLTLYFDFIGEAQTGDVWGGSTTNSSSTKRGVDLNGIDSVSGDSVPAGIDYFLLEYDIDYNNIDSDGVEAEFFCELRDGNTVLGFGEIMPSTNVLLKRGVDVFCRIDNSIIADLDGVYTVTGWFSFPYATEEVTQKVYFIQEDVADFLDENDRDFFSAYGIDKDLIKSYYNGEPVSVTIDEDDQPVIVRDYSTPTLGLFLENEWSGSVEELIDMTLYLPSGVTIDEDLTQNPSLACPLIYSGQQTRKNVYKLSSGGDENILNQDFLWGSKIEEKRFSCWLNVEDSIFGDADYVDLDYEVDLDYYYMTDEESTAIDIIGEGQSPVENYGMQEEEDNPIS
tara:strand:+ start:1755 stop:3032 length:1278 start_codon:yes stop_codon:yes gene_type:complete